MRETAARISSMKALCISVSVLLGAIGSADAVSRRPLVQLEVDSTDAKTYPVTKVIKLLQDMKVEIEKEAETDEEIYEKMACWCETNDKEKSQFLKDAEAKISELTTTIETSAARSAELSTEIEHHKSELTEAQQALNQATSIRENAAGEFHAEEKDLIESVKALEAAIIVLSKHHQSSGSLTSLIAKDAQVAKAMEVVRAQMQDHKGLLQGKITPHQRRLVLALEQQDPSATSATFRQTYVPQSGEIYGILQQMLETFKTNLADAQKQETNEQSQYEEIKAAKEAEIKAITASIAEKERQLAESDELHATSTEDLRLTQDSITEYDTFLLDLKQRCAATDKEWENRQSIRQKELSAIAEAISVLSADEAHDTFSRTFNPSFLQLRQQHTLSGPRGAAAKVLDAAASRGQNPKLAAIASKVRLDPFTKVKAAIDEMVTELTKEKAEDVQHRDYCVAELHQNELDTERTAHEKSDGEVNEEQLKSTIKTLTSEVENLDAEMAELHTQIQRMGEDREKQNKEFQAVIADQRESKGLLQKALLVLQRVYSTQVVNAEAGAFVQRSEVQAQQLPTPPPGFTAPLEGSSGSGSVLTMIESIIGDCEQMEAATIKDEQDAQEAYEVFVKDSNNALEQKQATVVTKNSEKAVAEQDLNIQQKDLEEMTTQLEQLSNAAGALHQSCDFLMKNFEIKQQGLQDEIDALNEAKAILSGMQKNAATTA